MSHSTTLPTSAYGGAAARQSTTAPVVQHKPGTPSTTHTDAASTQAGTVAFEGVGKTYHASTGPVHALQDISLSIPAGSIFGIIGRSGAGKSSLLRTINRLEQPTEGRVLVDGTDIGTLPEAQLVTLRRRIGMIFQHFNLLSAKTVWDNVALPLRVAGVPKAEIHQRVTELLDLVGLQGKHHTRPQRLSGGQKQRVGIARALVHRPEILLCDEATSALDPETTQAILALLRDINRDLGLTILLITHEMAVVRDIASHMAVIDGGRIVEAGATYDVFVRPQHPTTRSFLSGVTGITLPAFITGRLQTARPDGASEEVIRVTFAGNHATDPMLAKLTSEMGVAVNILAGAIEEIGTRPFGNLLISVDAARGAEARAYLERHGLLTEVLGYVR